MTNDIVLEVKDLGKRFKIYPRKLSRVLEWAALGKGSFHFDFWAVRNVEFNLVKGEILGIIGPNGAGKTTLLKMISGILDPTEGSYNVQGKVLSLFELSAGLDPNLTGRSNVVRSAKLLGFPDFYVEKRLDRIKEFSELGDFFEREIKTYSTGMRTRLSFSMFAFLDCDILVLDEILAVGDIFFRQKCYQRMEELIERNVSIIYVSHNFESILRFCRRVITLHRGEIIYTGNPGDAIKAFMTIQGSRPQALSNIRELRPEGEARVTIHAPEREKVEANLITASVKQSEHLSLLSLSTITEDKAVANVIEQDAFLSIKLLFESKRKIQFPILNVEIMDEYNLLIHGRNSLQFGGEALQVVSPGEQIEFAAKIKMSLAPKHYIFNINVYSAPVENSGELMHLFRSDKWTRFEHIFQLRQALKVSVVPSSAGEILFEGICNLEGEIKSRSIPGGVAPEKY